MIQDQPHPAGELRELIAFRIGQQEFCVDVSVVREIRGWTPATPLPKTPEHIRGVINLRGTVLPIVELAARLGLPVSETTARSVIVVVKIEKSLVGLLVDAVSDILNVTQDQIQPPPDLGCETVKSFLKGLITVDDRMISEIAIDKLLPDLEEVAA